MATSSISDSECPFSPYFKAEGAIGFGEDHHIVVGDVFLRNLLDVGDDGRHCVGYAFIAREAIEGTPRSGQDANNRG